MATKPARMATRLFGKSGSLPGRKRQSSNTAPTCEAFVKLKIHQNIIGQRIASLADWIKNWQVMSPYGVPRINTEDVNRKGFQDGNEFQIQAEVVVLAKPKMAGLPYVIAGLVAALSTGKASRAFGRVPWR